MRRTYIRFTPRRGTALAECAATTLPSGREIEITHLGKPYELITSGHGGYRWDGQGDDPILPPFLDEREAIIDRATILSTTKDIVPLVTGYYVQGDTVGIVASSDLLEPEQRARLGLVEGESPIYWTAVTARSLPDAEALHQAICLKAVSPAMPEQLTLADLATWCKEL